MKRDRWQYHSNMLQWYLGARARLASLALLLFILLLLSMFFVAPIAHGQILKVKEFEGFSVGKKTVNAQAACISGLNCVLLFEPELGAFPTGTMPGRCAACTWIDYRTSAVQTVSYFQTSTNGGAFPVPIQAQNLANLCGSSTSYTTNFVMNGYNPCTFNSLYFGGQQAGPGFGQFVHVNDLFTQPGVDVQSASSAGAFATCGGNNTGNTLNDNATNCLAEVVNAASASNTSSVNVIAFDAVGQSSFNGSNQTHTVQASQLLTNSARPAGWFGDISKTYSSVETYNIQGGSQDITVGTMMDTSEPTAAFLMGNVVASARQAGHVTLRGAGGVNPQYGFWSATGTIGGEYIGAKPQFMTNPGNSPVYNDMPAWGTILGERGTLSGASNSIAFVSTSAGSAKTIANSPSGATSLDHVITITTTAPHSFVADIYHPINITGVGDAHYNIDCIPLTVTATTFTCNDPQVLPTGTATAAALAGNLVTLTMGSNPATAGFSTTQGVIVGGFSGADAFLNGVYTPASVTSTTITFSLTHANWTATTTGTVTAQGYPASGAGTATQSTEQQWTHYHSADTNFHIGYASPPNPALPGGTDKFLFTTSGNLNISGNLLLQPNLGANYVMFTASPTGTRTLTVQDVTGTVPVTIASGTSTLASGAVTTVTCAAAVTTAATGALTTDTISWAYASAPAAADGLMHVAAYVTSGNVNFLRCNPTAASQTGTALVINWRVVR